MPWYDNDNDNTEIVCIIDKSGSMCGLQKETIEGFNKFIEEQKEVPGKASVTLVFFNDRFNVLFEGKDLKEVESLTDKTYIPDGGTALLDTIGSTIADVKKRIFALEEEAQPGKVLFCIITDGEENSSSEYKKDDITKLLDDCEKDYSWGFAFLSADMGAIAEAGSFGVMKGMTAGFTKTASGVSHAYTMASAGITSYRSASKSMIKSGKADYIVEAEEKLKSDKK